MSATWLGHSTVLIRMGGATLLTDPVWAKRVSPFSFAGPERWVAATLPITGLPPIDLVLLSHNHYDHFDRAATSEIARLNPGSRWCVPPGLEKAVRGCGVKLVTDFEWWEQAQFDSQPQTSDSSASREKISIVAVPAQHFSGRTLAAAQLSLFELDAPPMLGVHWGTYRLAEELMSEPPRLTRQIWDEFLLDPNLLWLLAHGETRRTVEGCTSFEFGEDGETGNGESTH